MPAAWPTTSDVSTFLAGVLDLTATTGLNTSGRILAAVDWFEKYTGWIPFQAAGTDSTETYDPPGPSGSTYYNQRGGATILRLDQGYTAITSITVNGTAYVAGTDWFFKGRKVPYTIIEFAYPVIGPARSVSIVGKPGYCPNASIPDGAWQAVLARTCSLVADAYAQSILGLGIDWKEDDVSESVNAGAAKELGSKWQDEAEALANEYRRVSVGL